MFDDDSEVVDGQVVDHSHDKTFFFTFGGVLSVLIALTFAIVAIANAITSDEGEEMNSVVWQRTNDNTAPVGGVYTDVSAIPVAAPVAAAEPRSTEEVLAGVCGACHSAGVLNAPRYDAKADWKARLDAAGGVDGLVASAIAGKGSMPAKGGDASLSDEEIGAAVRAMLGGAGL